MDNQEANIDLVFRNGLKDYEVLPPPEVWNSIQPVIKRKQRPVVLLRTAAMVAVIISMSFLTYRWSREMSAGLDKSVISLNSEAFSPENSVLPGRPVSVTSRRLNPVLNSIETIAENSTAITSIPVVEMYSYPQVTYLQEDKGLTSDTRRFLNGPTKETLNDSQEISYKINSSDQLDLAEFIPPKVTDRWSIAAMASPTYYSNFSTGNDEFSKMLAASEEPLISYSGGVSFSYKINKRFSIQSGVYYSSLGQQVDGINSYGGFKQYVDTKGADNFKVLTGSGTIHTSNADVFLNASGPGERIHTVYTNDVFDPEKVSLNYISNNLRQNFSYLELPVILRYKVVDKTIDLNLIGGVSYNMLVNNSVYTMVDGAKYQIGETGLNPISISSSLGMGMEYNFSKKLSLNLEPTFRYYLNPFTQVTGSNLHPYSFGIFSGLSYKF